MTAVRPSSAERDTAQTHDRPKVWAMLAFGGLATVAVFYLLATGTELSSVARILVSSLSGCVFGWLAGRYTLARIGALVLLVAIVVVRIARDSLAF